MPGPNTFTGKKISFTYGRLLQVDSNGDTYDGYGDPVDLSGSGFYYQATPPSPNPTKVGAKWIDSSSGVEYTWVFDGDNYLWMQATAGLSHVEEIATVSFSSDVDLVPGTSQLIKVPAQSVFVQWTVVANAVGDMEFNIEASSFSSYPTFSSIVNSDFPALSSSDKATGSPTTWDQVSPNDIIRVSISSGSGIQEATVFLKFRRIS